MVPLTTSSVNENDHLSIGIVAAILSGDSHLTERDLAATDVLPSLKKFVGSDLIHRRISLCARTPPPTT